MSTRDDARPSRSEQTPIPYRIFVDRGGVLLSLEDARRQVIWVQDSEDLAEMADHMLECMVEHLERPFMSDSSLQLAGRDILLYEVTRTGENWVLLADHPQPLACHSLKTSLSAGSCSDSTKVIGENENLPSRGRPPATARQDMSYPEVKSFRLQFDALVDTTSRMCRYHCPDAPQRVRCRDVPDRAPRDRGGMRRSHSSTFPRVARSHYLVTDHSHPNGHRRLGGPIYRDMLRRREEPERDCERTRRLAGNLHRREGDLDRQGVSRCETGRSLRIRRSRSAQLSEVHQLRH